LAIYGRVSTERQDFENQMAQLREWAALHNHDIVGEYVDVASGARRRERVDDLYDDARSRRFDSVAIWSIDRLTRQGPLQTLLYLSDLNLAGAKVDSHQQPYLNPEHPFYSTLVAMLADIAKMERDLISQRTKAGLAKARSRGKRLGRPPGSKDKKTRNKAGYYLRSNQGGSRKQAPGKAA